MSAIRDHNLDDDLAAHRLVTTREAAALLALSESKVFELLADGKLPRVKIGGATGATRIRLSAILAFISAGEHH